MCIYSSVYISIYIVIYVYVYIDAPANSVIYAYASIYICISIYTRSGFANFQIQEHVSRSHFGNAHSLTTARSPLQKAMQGQAPLPIAQGDDPARAPRRRLSYKQPDPAMQAAQAGEEPHALPIAIPQEELELRKVLKALYHQLEKFRCRMWDTLSEEDKQSPAICHFWRSDLRSLGQQHRSELINMWSATGDTRAAKFKEIAENWASGCLLVGQDSRYWKGLQGLFTWQGEFGLLKKEEILGDAWPEAEDVVAILKIGDHIRNEINEMERFVAHLKENHHLEKYAWSFELNQERYEQARSVSRSPQTNSDTSPARSLHWSESSTGEVENADEEPLRFHCHATLRFKFGKSFRKDQTLRFMDAYAVPSVAVNGRKRRFGDFDMAGNQAFFYTQVAKKGTLAQGANWYPFRHYLVNTDWVMNLWQQGKVTAQTARAVIVQCKKNVPRLLENHDVVEREGKREQLVEVVRRTRLALESEMRPCREVPEVTEWEATFKKTRFRYNFLILDGPSKMGKTLFCRSRSLGGGELLEIDCAGADTPDLSGFQFGRHTMVLCDEGSAQMVLRYKKLFQASASFVTLGSSKTNCHAYDVWAHGVKFVVTSNRWKSELDDLAREDSSWLSDNSVYVYVDRPLWQASA